VPSKTAFATSVISARDGTGLSIMLSIIWVAQITSLPLTCVGGLRVQPSGGSAEVGGLAWQQQSDGRSMFNACDATTVTHLCCRHLQYAAQWATDSRMTRAEQALRSPSVILLFVAQMAMATGYDDKVAFR